MELLPIIATISAEQKRRFQEGEMTNDEEHELLAELVNGASVDLSGPTLCSFLGDKYLRVFNAR